MALKAEKDSPMFAKWVHTENGKVLVRRIHRIEVQARNGQLYTIKGKQLPDSIQTTAGEGHKGIHMAQILLRPEKISKRGPYTPPESNPFPSARDVGCACMGVVGALFLKFLLELLFALS